MPIYVAIVLVKDQNTTAQNLTNFASNSSVFNKAGIPDYHASTSPPPPPPPSTTPKIGDLNGDSSVNITDLSLLLSSYGQNTTQCLTNNTFRCDLSTPPDGIINIFDISILLSNYGK
jgi:hypothetical protein